MKKIYISHRYGGLQQNADRVAEIINELIKHFPNVLFVSPIHALGFSYQSVEYKQGLDMCLEYQRICDETWVFDDYSESIGVQTEISNARSLRQRVLIVKGAEGLDSYKVVYKLKAIMDRQVA